MHASCVALANLGPHKRAMRPLAFKVDWWRRGGRVGFQHIARIERATQRPVRFADGVNQQSGLRESAADGLAQII